MGRQAGFTIPQEERDRIAATKLEQSAQRGTWEAIRRAIAEGDRELAHDLIDRRIALQEAEAG